MPRKYKGFPSEKGTVMESGSKGSSRKRSQRKTPYPLPEKGHIPGTDSYEMEKIVDYRLSPCLKHPETATEGAKRMVYFVVKWYGYGDDEMTLEPAINLTDSLDDVKKFLADRGFQLEVSEQTQETWLAKLHDGTQESDIDL